MTKNPDVKNALSQSHRPLLHAVPDPPSMQTSYESCSKEPFVYDQNRNEEENYEKKGSVRGSIFNFFSSTVGAGALAVPYAFSHCGLLVGSALLIGVARSTTFSVHLLIQARIKSGLVSYEELAVGLYNKYMGYAVAAAIIIMCFGASVAFILAVGDILEEGLLDVLGGFLTRQELMIIFWAFLMFPLSMVENMNSLRFSSGFGIANSGYLVFATTLHSLQKIFKEGFPNLWDYSSATFWPSSVNGIVTACPIIIFAYICQINVFSIFGELKSGTAKKMEIVTHGGITIISIFYFLLASFTYLEFGRNTNGNILTNYCVQNDPNPLMILAYVGYAFTITMAYPMTTHPTRHALHALLYQLFENGERRKSDEETQLLRTNDESIPKMSRIRCMSLSVCIAVGGLLVALVAPGISTVFGLVGGTSASFVCFVLPALFALKLKLARRWSGQYICTWLLLCGGILIGLFSTILTLKDTISGEGNTGSLCKSNE